jgi:hypothetical protein
MLDLFSVVSLYGSYIVYESDSRTVLYFTHDTLSVAIHQYMDPMLGYTRRYRSTMVRPTIHR